MDKIVLLNAATIDAEADIEVAVALDEYQQRAIERCEANGGKKRFRWKAGSLTGTPDFTIDKLQASFDSGSNYVDVQTFTGLAGDTAAEHTTTNPLLMEITAPLTGATHLKILATVTTLDGSNKLVVTSELILATLQ